MKPKMYFKDEIEANTYLKEWQTRLFLEHWNIKLYGSDDLVELAGLSEIQWVNSCGTITLLSGNKIDELDCIEKCPHEKTLIHELLHFKYMCYTGQGEIIDLFYEEKQHQTLEQMAKSLYMAKYNLPYEWFKR